MLRIQLLTNPVAYLISVTYFGLCKQWSKWRRVAGHSSLATYFTLSGFCTKQVLPNPKECLKVPPWLVLPAVHCNHQPLQGLEADAAEFEKLCGVSKYMELFEAKVRWFVASRLILSTKKLDDPTMRELHYGTMARTGHFPTYVTSLTLMKSLIRVREELWIPILQALVDDRVVVLVDWDRELSPLRISFYDLGLILPPHSGDSDPDTFKIESDASHYRNIVTLACGTQLDLSTGTAASLIWNVGKVIDCQIAPEFQSVDSEYAEAVGILIALKRGKKLPVNIEKVDVVTDNLPNYEVLVGIRELSKCKHPDVMKAILQAAKKYKVCRFRCEERESLSFVNALSREAKEHSLLSYIDLEEIFGMNGSSRLWGMPITRIKQAETFIKKKTKQSGRAI